VGGAVGDPADLTDVLGVTKTEFRRAAYDAAVPAAIDAAPSLSNAERDHLSRAWRKATGSALTFQLKEQRVAA
jgi:hypothetical protein